ncbi:MAG: hypothetical protein SGPRY_005452 [Prymnesium sp.]
MPSACLRCKTLKVRCENLERGSCARCLKANQPCLLAPPSRQGKRNRSPLRNSELFINAGTFGPVCLTSGGWTPNVHSRGVIRQLVREWAAISLMKNEWAMMEDTMDAVRMCNFDLQEVMTGVEKLLFPSSSSPRPLQERMNRSTGLFLVRRHLPSSNGDLVVFANPKFEECCRPVNGVLCLRV